MKLGPLSGAAVRFGSLSRIHGHGDSRKSEIVPVEHSAAISGAAGPTAGADARKDPC